MPVLALKAAIVASSAFLRLAAAKMVILSAAFAPGAAKIAAARRMAAKPRRNMTPPQAIFPEGYIACGEAPSLSGGAGDPAGRDQGLMEIRQDVVDMLDADA